MNGIIAYFPVQNHVRIWVERANCALYLRDAIVSVLCPFVRYDIVQTIFLTAFLSARQINDYSFFTD